MQHLNLSRHQNVQFPESLADVRGFEVRSRSTDEKVGKVDDLICSADGQIRYLDVDLGGFFSSKRVALPIGAAQVDRANDVVYVDMTKEQAKALPEYTGDAASITDEYETGVRGAFAGGAAGAATAGAGAAATGLADDDLYDQGRFYAERGGAAAREARLTLAEEQLSIGTRQVQAGEVALRKTVETEHVRQQVPLVHEEVVIERHALPPDAPLDEASIGEKEIRVPLVAEEAVVEKRAVATEEVVVGKRQVTENQTVEADLRRERLDVDRNVDTLRGSAGSTGAADLSSGSTGSTGTGLGDKLKHAAEGVKDRLDGNPRT